MKAIRYEMDEKGIGHLKNMGKSVISMRINDELLDKLGTYFVYHEVYNRYGITFESFVDRWTRGILEI